MKDLFFVLIFLLSFNFAQNNYIDIENIEAIDVIDMDADGDLDFLSTAHSASNAVQWHENDGSNNFTNHLIDNSTSSARDVITADIDGDGDRDVIVSFSEVNEIRWYENNGLSNFISHTIFSDADGVTKLAAVDMENDGDIDLLSVSQRDDKIIWYENDGSGSFNHYIIENNLDGASGIDVADIDSDGDIDIIASGIYSTNGDINWYENDGSQGFTKHLVDNIKSVSVHALDFDSDGDLDIIASSGDINLINWYENDGFSNFTSIAISLTTNHPSFIYPIDFDNDGDTDIISNSYYDGNIVLHENKGSDYYKQHIISSSVENRPGEVYAINMDEDNDLDIVASLTGINKLVWYESHPGCIDELACNYDENANLNDFSCDYHCHNSGDYSLAFDGDDEVVLGDLGNFQNFEIKVQFKSYNEEINGTKSIFSINPGIDCEPLISFYINNEGFLGAQIRDDNADCVGARTILSDFSIASINGNVNASIKYDNGTFSLLIDNEVVDALSNIDIDLISPNVSARIGSMPYPTTAGQPDFKGFYGEIDLLQIFSNNEIIVDYGFHSGSGDILYDHSGNQNHGIIHGATWVENIYGCTDELACNFSPTANISDDSCDYSCHDNGDFSLSFDGINDYVVINDSPILSPRNLTLEIKINQPQLLGGYNRYLNKSDGEDGYEYSLGENTIDGICGGVSNPSGFTGNGICSGYFPTSNTFFNFSLVFNSDVDSLFLFLDGVKISQLEVVDEIIDSDGQLCIGSYFKYAEDNEPLFENTFEGKIDEIRISSSALYSEDYVPQQNFNTDMSTVALFKFDSGSGDILYDHSGNQNHGIIHGATWVENIYGCTDELACNFSPTANISDDSCNYSCHDNGDYSLSFDGELDYVEINQLFDNVTAFTLSTWIKPNQQDGSGFIFYNGYGGEFDLALKSDGNLEAGIKDGTGAANWNWLNYDISSLYGTRIHIAMTFDGNDFKLFVNNEIVASSSVAGSLSTPSYLPKIGDRRGVNYDGDRSFDGNIENMSIWSIALTEEEIINHSYLDPDRDEEGLLSHWKFNSGSGEILYDHSGNGNHGAINGATWTYDIPLHIGANLISFMSLPEDNSVSNVLSSLDGIAEGIIGEGVAATANPVLGWVGSLTHLSNQSGYWLKVNQDTDFYVTSENISDPDMLFSLNTGANLISYPSGDNISLEDAIPSPESFNGIIGEGIAASANPVLGWVGSLTEFEPNHGYWFKVSEEMDFQYQYDSTDELSRSIYTNEDKDYYQSSEQAFYFIEDIENIEVGDMVSAYCNGIKVGSRQWSGSYTDIPAMGNDNSDLTKDYCRSNQLPVFMVEKLNGETYQLTGDIPVWESNGLHMLSTLEEAIILPESFSLAAAYPNPFNPTTTISFAIPADADVSISVYNLQGREVASLASGSYDAGYNQVIWNADNHSSGVYFVKMLASDYVNTQKLMLVK